VKYHQGFSSDVSTPGGPVHLTLAFNPSHLEIVNPVVEGSVRARMDRRADPKGKQVLPVLVHGDAAFAGQGVVRKRWRWPKTRGYTTGGTVHIIINNQIGFTTSDPRDMRSTLYCTDIVKMIEAPVLHVNGDDPKPWCWPPSWRWNSAWSSRRTWWWTSSVSASWATTSRTRPADPAADVQEDRQPTPARASCTPTSWPRRAWAIRWATTWSRPTVPPWMPASTRLIRC
jgi:hypothetical protein